MGAQRRRTWDEKELARILAAQQTGISTREIAARFSCNPGTIQRKLLEMRARSVPLAVETCG